jgi:hypothetical protein
MGLFKRKSKADEAKVVVDLDEILAKPVAFRFAGRVHTIKPIQTKEFYALANATAELWALRDAKELTADQLIDRYTALISSVCHSIRRKDIEGMTQSQVTALYQLIMDTVMGKTQASDQQDVKKKTSLK